MTTQFQIRVQCTFINRTEPHDCYKLLTLLNMCGFCPKTYFLLNREKTLYIFKILRRELHYCVCVEMHDILKIQMQYYIHPINI
jgi:hypothetical protein